MLDSTSSRKVYHLNPRYHAFTLSVAAIGFLMPFACFILPIKFSPPLKDIWAGLLIFLAGWYLLVIGVVDNVRRNRLVVSGDGIECRDSEFLIYGRTTWENVEHIWISEQGDKCVIVLKEPALPKNRIAAWILSKLELGRVMRLDHFMWHWQHSDLEQAIRQYAPSHVFENAQGN
ncbi:MAG TPA: hypothetical protein VMP08_25960 [Anaerolineae bacterium]|nr:hypothetical protein [Anaerolineae bacterium]